MIYAIMIVRRDDANRYFEQSLDRASRWSSVHVALEPGCRESDYKIACKYAGSVEYISVSQDENEGMAKNQAWLGMQRNFSPSTEDVIALIKPTEVVLNHEAIGKAVKEYPGVGLMVNVCHLWDSDHIRIDGSWEPKLEMLCLPWRRGAIYPDYRLRVGRLPTYHFGIDRHGVAVSDMIDHDMMTFDDKLMKWDWYERVGASDFYSIDHITSIKRTPVLHTWEKGGVLNGWTI